MAIKFQCDQGELWVMPLDVVAVVEGSETECSIRLRGGHSFLVNGRATDVMMRITDAAGEDRRVNAEIERGD